MNKNFSLIAFAILTLCLAACNGHDEVVRKYNYYILSGYEVDEEAPGADTVYIPGIDLQIVAERNYMPLLSNDEYSTVIYCGHKGNVDYNSGFFVGSTTRKPCKFHISDGNIITQEIPWHKMEPITEFNVDKTGAIYIGYMRTTKGKPLSFNNWAHDLGALKANWTIKSDITVTGKTGYRIRIADGVTVTFNNVSILNSLICEGNATVVLAENSYNLVQVSQNYNDGFKNGGVGTTLIIEGSGELRADMSSDRDRAAIGGDQGDIIIKGGTITALGGNGGAGIGASRTCTTGKITITGGNITAIGGYNSAGIGSGDRWSYDDVGEVKSYCGDILITGGTVTATGGEFGAGIGSGYRSVCNTITILNSVTSVTAIKGYNSNSIGAGYQGSCGTVTIEDGAAVNQD